MSYLFHERVTAEATVKDVNDLAVPNNATSARLQADTSDIRYTCDGATNPSQTTGMVLVNGLEPEDFLLEDILKIRFTRGSGTNGGLNIHYYAGRDV